MNSSIEEMIKELSNKTRSIIDLRYHLGMWCVMVELGNMMVVVPGSIKKTPQEALEHCLERWRNRSTERPFTHYGDRE